MAKKGNYISTLEAFTLFVTLAIAAIVLLASVWAVTRHTKIKALGRVCPQAIATTYTRCPTAVTLGNDRQGCPVLICNPAR